MENLKELLMNKGIEQEVASNILNILKEEKIFLSKNENIDERYSKMKFKKEELDTKLSDALEQLKELDSLKNEKEILSNKVKEITINSAVDNWLSNNNAKHKSLLAFKLKSNLEIDQEGNVLGLEEAGNALKEEYKDLFNASLTGGTKPINPPQVKTEITKDQFERMSYEERVSLINENRELYLKLKGD